MQTITTTKAIIDYRNNLANTQRIGFVPTMGALHQGHLALIKQSKQENDITVISIFVNPTQFNNPDDLKNYPRNNDHDLKLAQKAGVDCVFMPSEDEMYPLGYTYSLLPKTEIANMLEGPSRPGHFAGVLTVVNKLFHLIRPTHAYFGEKDFQQKVLVEEMVKDCFLPMEVVGCPIIREASGLPLSSRNENLSPEEKIIAEKAFQIIHQITLETIETVKQKLHTMGIKVEYIEHYRNRIFTAFHVGKVRLIDNFTIGELTCSSQP